MKLNAISLWQPWATWIAKGLKTIETRTHTRFSCLVGQRIAIHASKTFDDAAGVVALLVNPECPIVDGEVHPSGCIVATAYVSAFGKLTEQDSKAALFDCSAGDRYGLFLSDVRLVTPPIPATGRQGIFPVELPDEPTKGILPMSEAPQEQVVETAAPPEGEQPKEYVPIIGDAMATDMLAAYDEIVRCQGKLAQAESAKKSAKANLEEAQEHLFLLVGQAKRGPLPLFEGETPAEQAPEEWRGLLVTVLGLNDEILEAFNDHNPQLNTMGDLVDWMNTKGEWWAKDIKGIGEAYRKEIEDAMMKFWEEHPQDEKKDTEAAELPCFDEAAEMPAAT